MKCCTTILWRHWDSTYQEMEKHLFYFYQYKFCLVLTLWWSENFHSQFTSAKETSKVNSYLVTGCFVSSLDTYRQLTVTNCRLKIKIKLLWHLNRVLGFCSHSTWWLACWNGILQNTPTITACMLHFKNRILHQFSMWERCIIYIGVNT